MAQTVPGYAMNSSMKEALNTLVHSTLTACCCMRVMDAVISFTMLSWQTNSQGMQSDTQRWCHDA